MFLEEKAPGEASTPVDRRKAKLSEAIREGAKIRPHVRRHYFHEGKSCAVSAAMEYYGYLTYDEYYEQGGSRKLINIYVRIPGIHNFPYKILGEIIRKNDNTHMTREEIADWVEAQGY